MDDEKISELKIDQMILFGIDNILSKGFFFILVKLLP